MELLVTVKDLNRVNRLFGYPIDGIIVGSHFASFHHYSLKDLRMIKTICKANEKKMYVILDEMVEEKDRSLLYEYLEFLRDIEVDGIYFTDLAVLAVSEELKMKHLLIYDSDTLMTNSVDAAFFLKRGIDSVVLAREITLEEILQIAKRNKGNVDLQIHGFLKMSTSKRHFLKNYFKHIQKDVDYRGKETLTIVEETRDYRMPILENESGTRIYSDFVLCMYEEMPYLKNYIKRGIINDLFMSEEELYAVLDDYRHLTKDNARDLKERLEVRFRNRHFDTGYLYQKTNKTK